MGRSFIKMHGLGNDFVILDARDVPLVLDEAACRRLADRHRGIGCDQIVVLERPLPDSGPTLPSDSADVFLRLFNSDGSVVSTCGNATRCVAQLLFAAEGRSRVTLQTLGGLVRAERVAGGHVCVDQGVPRCAWEAIPLARDVDTLRVPLAAGSLQEPCCVNVGNTHAVFFVPNAEAVPLETLGPGLENNPLFPDRSNIEVVQILSPTQLRMRVWERGAGITQACGSGACAALVAAVRRGLTERAATVVLDGGDLAIAWREEDQHVFMEGEATLVFRGEVDDALLNGEPSGS